MAEWLPRWIPILTLDHENPAAGGINLMTAQRFITQSLSLSRHDLNDIERDVKQ